MATCTTTTIDGYAHCRDSRCPGNDQQPVKILRHYTEWSYVDGGGNMPGIERSSAILAFADETTDAPCPHCDAVREVAEQLRPRYTALSGHRQDGLLHVKDFDAAMQANRSAQGSSDAVVAELLREMADLRAQVAKGDARPSAGEQPKTASATMSPKRQAALDAARAAAAEKEE